MGSNIVLPEAGRQGEVGGGGVWGEFRPPSPASSVRIFSNRHRQLGNEQMENKYLNEITTPLKQARPKLSTTHRLEFKNVFGAVGGYVNGKIFVSYGKFGVALRLPPDTLDMLFQEKEAKHLKYFPSGHVKKEYAVLSKQITKDMRRFRKLVDESTQHVLSLKGRL